MNIPIKLQEFSKCDPFFGGISKEFIDNHKITKVLYAGNKNTWTDHYKVPIEMGIMEYIDYSHNELSTSKIINRIIAIAWKPPI